LEGFKINILLVALALALDAAGVTMAIGCGTKTNLRDKMKVIFSFGFFQFLFALIGGLVGNYIDHNFFAILNINIGIGTIRFAPYNVFYINQVDVYGCF